MISRKKNPNVTMAKSISSVVCGCGNLYIRLHDGHGKIFAAASVDRGTGFMLAESIVVELSEGGQPCDGIH